MLHSDVFEPGLVGGGCNTHSLCVLIKQETESRRVLCASQESSCNLFVCTNPHICILCMTDENDILTNVCFVWCFAVPKIKKSFGLQRQLVSTCCFGCSRKKRKEKKIQSKH